MSDPILTLLKSDDPNQRKRGVNAAAKSGDKRYIKVLAHIYKTDPDQSVRELAKKAGSHIHKQTTAQQTATVEPSVDDLLGGGVPSFAPPDGEQDPEQAELHYDKAFQLHLQGDDAHASLELGTAFYLNKGYANDSTAVAFAAEMTGLPAEKAVPYISNPNNWRELTNKYGGFKKGARARQPSEFQTLFLWIAGGVLLVVAIGFGLVFFTSPSFQEAFRTALSGLFGGALSSGGAAPTATPLITPTP